MDLLVPYSLFTIFFFAKFFYLNFVVRSTRKAGTFSEQYQFMAETSNITDTCKK